MIQEFSGYQVEIINTQHRTETGNIFSKTARILFSVPATSKPVVIEMGFLDTEEIYNLIDHKKDILLSNCYLEGLSIADYRANRKLDPKSEVELMNFDVSSSFLDSSVQFDLSHCIFKGKSVNLEGAVVSKGGFIFNNSIFQIEEFNFSNVKFLGGTFDFANTKFDQTEINFKNTIFSEGKKDFQYTDFGTGEKFFNNLEFGDGDVSFINTHFNNGNVSFKVARFGNGRVDFHFAKFGEGDISFERTDFQNGDVDFRTVEFGDGRVNFNRCRIGTGDISFEGCDQNSGKFSFKRSKLIKGNISFELAEMENVDASFDKTNFGQDSISFYNSKFKTLSLSQCHLDHYTDLRLRSCRYLDLSNTIVRDIIDLKPYEFDEKIDIINFGGMRLIGRIYIDWHRNKVNSIIQNQQESTHRLKAEQFRTLKENFNVCGSYSDEDLAYLQFKRHEARHILQQNLSRSKLSYLWAYPWHMFRLLIFDRAGHYATNPVRVIISMIVTLTLFSLLYSVLIYTGAGEILESIPHAHGMNPLGIGFYHSTITFFTIGYGDYYPAGIIRWISGIEGFTGVFFMAYFTVAFVRKILR